MTSVKQEIVLPLLLAGCFLLLFGFAEFLYHKKEVKAEWTRKIVHVGTGIITLLFPVLLHSHWQVLFLCGSFLIILLASLRFKMLPSINNIGRFSYGSILYPIVVYGVYLVYARTEKGLIMFYLPILILAICDPVAALTGRRYPFGIYFIGENKKTISGSLAFFMVCMLITLGTFYTMPWAALEIDSFILLAVLISAVATVSEAIGIKGTDNLTIPASVAFVLNLII
ncbi:diacylglycerol/polyprenol kinase family protein [Dyadobacter psychrotolerans]|uniref:Phosphatidate cytidylyltransferase n=1 Tax=Dyadobacter psychrotolerans TaxID=2541721 RepID=A0A4R5DRK7_9BACT|nr:phosphatidate cytidylyltransferase [Dyadobacter psychrotolerans]TDE16327.1 phosphatidate cytidylyltransferase [Dyadobacter psychrotolerans]